MPRIGSDPGPAFFRSTRHTHDGSTGDRPTYVRDMAFRITTLAKALARRAALDDLMVTLTVARYTVRLLRFAARSPAERGLAETMGAMLEEAECAIHWLSSGYRERKAGADPIHSDDNRP